MRPFLHLIKLVYLIGRTIVSMHVKTYYFSYLLYGYSSILNDRSNVLEVGDAVFALALLPPTKGVHLVQEIGNFRELFVFGVHVALPKLKKGS